MNSITSRSPFLFSFQSLLRFQSFVLLLALNGSTETIRVYDGAHGHNEMHRYKQSGGKQPGEPFHAGTLGEGMRAAIAEIERGYGGMIEGWKRQ